MKTMKAVVLKDIGHLDQLALIETETPVPKAGETLIRIKAAALNHRDWWIVQGLYAKIKLPVILGSDGCGVVTSVGEGVDASWVGKSVIINPAMDWGEDLKAQAGAFRIFGMPDNGTLAEYTVVPASALFAKPAYLSDEAAAAIPLVGMTAYRALFTQGRLRSGETVLITGVGGGVASMAMKLALASGARVLVTSGDPEKLNKALSLGAAGGVSYRAENAVEQLMSLAKPLGGIDLILDGAGGKSFSDLIACLKPGGRFVTYGATAGNPETVDLRKIFWKQLTVQGSTMGTAQDFADMVRFLEKHEIRPVLAGTFPLEEFKAAFRLLADGRQFGKIILNP